MYKSKKYKKFINFNHPVYKLSKGIKLFQVKSRIQSFVSLQPDLYKMLISSSMNKFNGSKHEINLRLAEKGVPIAWIYCGFEKGYFVSYPGKGGYPDDYDPRNRPWYKEAITKKDINWGSPYFDVHGLGIVLPGTFTLINKNKPYGVLGIDITPSFLVSELMRKTGKVSKNEEKLIIDENGKLLISTDNLNKTTQKITFKKAYTNLLKQIKSKTSDQIQFVDKSENYILAYTKIKSLNWYYMEKRKLNYIDKTESNK